MRSLGRRRWWRVVDKLHEAVTREAAKLMRAKRSDYAHEDDPLANFRGSRLVGVDPWRGALVRLLDKVGRAARLVEKGGQGAVVDEGLADTVVDMVNYAVLFLALALEEVNGATKVRILTRLGLKR